MQKVFPNPNSFGKDYLDFPFGWNNVDTLLKVPLGYLQKAQNLEYKNGTLRRRKPFKNKSTVDFSSAGVFQGAFEYIDSNGASRILHGHNDGTIKEFVSAASSVDRVTGLTSAQKIRFTSMRGAVFSTNNSDSVRRGDTTTWRVAGPTDYPTNLSGSNGAGTNMAAGTYLFIAVGVIEVGGTAILKSDHSDIYSHTLGGAGSVDLTWTDPVDSRCTHVYIYRSLADVGGPYYYDGKVAIGAEAYTADTADANMSEQIADPLGRNGAMPKGKLITTASQRLVIANLSTASNGVHIGAIATDNYAMEYFPNDGRHQLFLPNKGEVTACIGLGVKDEDTNRRDLFLAQKTSIFILRDTDPDEILEEVAGNVGVLNPDGVAQWGGYLFFVSARGLEFFGPLGKPVLISQNVQKFFEGGGPLSLGGVSGSQYVYLEIWNNKLICSIRSNSGNTWGDSALILDLEAFDVNSVKPHVKAKFTHWDGPGMAFFLALQDSTLLLFDNQNLKMLYRDDAETQDDINDVATNIPVNIWTGGLLTERSLQRKTLVRVVVFHISDADTSLTIEMDYNYRDQMTTLLQLITAKDWNKAWNKIWEGSDRWRSNVPLLRRLSGHWAQAKIDASNSGDDYIFLGLSLIYRAQNIKRLGKK